MTGPSDVFSPLKGPLVDLAGYMQRHCQHLHKQKRKNKTDKGNQDLG